MAFATPYAILIFHQYGKLIPMELDEAARVDGATPLQVYLRIYLPLMAPALAAVATYALLLAWNEYLYQFLLLSSPRSMTVAAAIDQFFDSDEAPWNYMMAARTGVFAAADRRVLRAAPLHGGRTDHGRHEGIALRAISRTRTIAPRRRRVSFTPASRRQCQAIAWLLEVTGIPTSASIGRHASATRRLVHETKIASSRVLRASAAMPLRSRRPRSGPRRGRRAGRTSRTPPLSAPRALR